MSNIEAVQAQESNWNPTLSRRDLIKGSVLAGTAAFLAGCNPFESSPNYESDAAEKLFRYLGDLPPSNLRDILINHAANYFISPTPQSVRFGDTEIKVYKPQVISNTRNAKDLHGETGITRVDDPYFATMLNNDEIEIHIPGIVQEHEKQFVADHLASDGSLIVTIPLGQGKKYDLAISPTITVTTPDSRSRFYTPDVPIQEKFIYIKEAATVLIFDLMVAEIEQSSRELKKSFDVLGPDGNKTKTNLFVEAIISVWSSKQRFSSVMDLGGYYLAFKAIKGTEIEQVVRQYNPDYIEAMDAADKITLGYTDHEILTSAINWVLNTPSALDLDHVGNITEVP